MAWSLGRDHVTAKPNSEGEFPTDSHLFFIVLLCWHRNTSGGRERAREKMTVLIPVLGEECSGSGYEAQHGKSSSGETSGISAKRDAPFQLWVGAAHKTKDPKYIFTAASFELSSILDPSSGQLQAQADPLSCPTYSNTLVKE